MAAAAVAAYRAEIERFGASDDPAIRAGLWAAAIDNAAGVPTEDAYGDSELLFASPTALSLTGYRRITLPDGSVATWDGKEAQEKQ